MRNCVAALDVHEQLVHALDVLDLDLGALALLGRQARRDDHVDRVAQARLHRHPRQQVERVVGHLDVLLLAADLEDLPYLSSAYGTVEMIISRSSRSSGMPCGDL